MPEHSSLFRVSVRYAELGCWEQTASGVGGNPEQISIRAPPPGLVLRMDEEPFARPGYGGRIPVFVGCVIGRAQAPQEFALFLRDHRQQRCCTMEKTLRNSS